MATGQHSDLGHLAQPNVVWEVRHELELAATQRQPTVEVIVLVQPLKADDVEQLSVSPICLYEQSYESKSSKNRNKIRTISALELLEVLLSVFIV